MKREASTEPARRIRLNSYLAQCGLGSRRACEKLILAGDVSIDGMPVRDLATFVDPARHVVRVGNQPIRPSGKIYLAFNKPVGLICSREEQYERAKTIYDRLPKQLQNLFYVGRLDRDTEGLLFLTNDGDWAQLVAHPKNEVEKIYVAEVLGRIGPTEIRRARAGIQDEGELLKFERMRVLGRGVKDRRAQQLEIVLKEGKKREIRRLLRALGAPVIRLKRLEIGGVRLGGLAPGAWRELTQSEIRRFVR